jgi:hypothetical protein
MKTIVTAILTASCLYAASRAQAAQLRLVVNGNIATIYLNAALGAANGGDLNDKFDTIDFSFTTAPGVTMTNVAGVREFPGEPFNYRNGLLNADPLDGGLGWNILTPIPAMTPTTVQWTGGPLGKTINTGDAAGGGLFLHNLQLSSPVSKSSGIARILLLRAGNIVADMQTPEPSSFALAAAGVALALRRRGR